MINAKQFTLIALCAFLVISFSSAAMAAGITQAGQPLPEDIVLTKLAGGTAKLHELAKGQKTLVIFFNTACSQCLKETKWALKKLTDVQLILISIDLGGAKRVDNWINKYLGQLNVNKDLVFVDPEFIVPQRFGLSLTPSSIVINKEGIVAGVHAGFKAGDDEEIEALLNK